MPPMAEETMQGIDLLIGSKQGFRVLLKDTSTITLGESGIKFKIHESEGGETTEN